LATLSADPAPQAGFFCGRTTMDREEGFPPHVIGFMKRKREKDSKQKEPEKS
jgi:hypothetical protein